MQEQKYVELEERASAVPEDAERSHLEKLIAKQRIRQEIDLMRAEGKALTLTDEEMDMLQSFRRFKLRMRKDGEMFSWQTRMPEGVQLVEETALILHPNESR